MSISPFRSLLASSAVSNLGDGLRVVFSYGAIPLGALAGGWLASAFGLRAPFLIGGAIVVVAGLGIGHWVNDAPIAHSRERTAGAAPIQP